MVALLAFCVAVVYIPGRNAPFYLDDYESIVENPNIRIGESGEAGAWQALLWGGRIKTRPLSYLSFAGNYLASGLDPSAFRRVNVLLHVASTVVLFLLLIRWLEYVPDRVRPADRVWVALSASALWGLHPISVSTVTYIVQRMTGGMALFFLVALYAASRGWEASTPSRRKAWYGAATLSVLLSAGFKEIGLTAPFVLFAAWVTWKRGDAPLETLLKERKFRVAGTALLSVGVLGLTAAVVYSYPTYAGTRDFTMAERLLSQGRAIPFYISMVLLPLPSRIFLDYDFPVSRSLLQPPMTLPALTLVAVLCLVTVLLFRRDRVAGFSLFWFLFLLVPESTVLNLEMVFLHRLYLPSAGLCLLVTYGLYRVFGGVRPADSLRRRGLAAAAILSCGFLAAGTIAVNRAWASPERFLRDSIRQFPEKVRLYTALTHYYLQEGRYGLAVDAGEEAARRFPGQKGEDLLKVRNNMAIASVRLGRVDRAISIWTETLSVYGEDPKLMYNLGTAYLEKNDTGRARLYLEAALAAGMRSPDLTQQLEEVYRKEGIPGLQRDTRAADAGRPSPAMLLAKANASYEAGDWEKAAIHFREGLNPALAPSPAYRDLFRAGYALMRTRDYGEAERMFLAARKVDPADPNLDYNLACLYALMGERGKSLGALRAAADRGFRERVVLTDPDLESVRSVPEFRRILGRMGL